jgi:preprotein translocase subunit SecG
MSIILHVVHVLTALALVVLILMQQGQGASAGASFGAGASQTVFGGQGSGNFLTRTTAILATVFFVTSLALAWQARQGSQGQDDLLPALETQPAPEESTGDGNGGSPSAPSDVPAAPESGQSESPQSVPDAGDVPSPADQSAPAEQSTGNNE